MAEGDNRGPKESFRRTQGGRKRREPSFIDATATEVPGAESAGEASSMAPPTGPDLSKGAAIVAQDASTGGQTEPVLFGAPIRDASIGHEESVRPPVETSGTIADDAEAATHGYASGEPAPADAGLEAGAVPEAAASLAGDGMGPTQRRSRHRSPVPLLLGIVTLALLASIAGLLFWDRNRSERFTSSIAALQGRVAALEQQPDPAAKASADVAALESRTSALDGELAPLKSAVADLQARLSDVANKADASAARLAAAEQAPSPASSASIATGEITALSSKVDDLSRRLDGMQSQAQSPASAPVDLGPIEGRVAALDGQVAALDRRIEALTTAVAAAPRPDLTPVQASLGALERRLGPLEAAIAAPKTNDRVTEARAEGSADEARAAPLAVVAQALTQAIAEGRPFGPEVDALRALDVDDASVAPFTGLAAKGAPTVAGLAGQWTSVAKEVLAASRPKTSDGVLGRFAERARNLVQVRQVESRSGEDPGSVVSRIDAALDGGDLRGALAEREKLPEAGRRASQNWADAAQSRLDAEAAAQGLVSRAIAMLAKAKG